MLLAPQAGNGTLPPTGQHGTSAASVAVPRVQVVVPVLAHMRWKLPVWPAFKDSVADSPAQFAEYPVAGESDGGGVGIDCVGGQAVATISARTRTANSLRSTKGHFIARV